VRIGAGRNRTTCGPNYLVVGLALRANLACLTQVVARLRRVRSPIYAGTSVSYPVLQTEKRRKV
jgi:hypothetical protein